MNELLCLLTTVGATMTMTCNPKPAPTPIPTVTVTATPSPLVCPACPSPTPTASPFVRAMWVSDAGATVASAATGSSTRSTFFSNLAAKGINRVFIECSGLLAANRAQLKDFVVDARNHGVETEFLLNGYVSGYTVATAFDRMVTYAGHIKSYQAAYCPTGSESACPVAMHIDLEPHLYPEWKTALAATQNAYLSGIKRLKTALGSVKLSADVTNWYDGSGYNVNGASFSKQIFDAGVDRMVLMNYTDSFTQMQARAVGEVDLACQLGKEVISGSDAMKEGTDAASMALTFFEEGYSTANGMNAGFASLKNYFAAKPCFKGVAGFDYDDVIVLK